MIRRGNEVGLDEGFVSVSVAVAFVRRSFASRSVGALPAFAERLQSVSAPTTATTRRRRAPRRPRPPRRPRAPLSSRRRWRLRVSSPALARRPRSASPSPRRARAPIARADARGDFSACSSPRTPTLRDARLRRSSIETPFLSLSSRMPSNPDAFLPDTVASSSSSSSSSSALSHPPTTGSRPLVSSPRARPPPARAAGSAPAVPGPRRPMRGATAATRRPWRRPGQARSSPSACPSVGPGVVSGASPARTRARGPGRRRVWTRPRRATRSTRGRSSRRRRPSRRRPRPRSTRARHARERDRPHPRLVPVRHHPLSNRTRHRATRVSCPPARVRAATGARVRARRRCRRAPPRARPHRPRRRRRGHRVSTRDGFLLSADSAPRHNALVSWPPSATVFFGIPRVRPPTRSKEDFRKENESPFPGLICPYRRISRKKISCN